MKNIELHEDPPGDFDFQVISKYDKSFIVYLKERQDLIKKELREYDPSTQSQVQDGVLQGRYFELDKAIKEFTSGRY